MDAYFQKSCLSFFAHHGLYFFLCFFYHFLNSGRVNSAVHDQTFQSDSCHFSSDRFKSGKYDCLRRIINNKLYACQCLEGTDITSFTSDNTSLHLIVGELHHGNCCLCHMIGSTALNGRYNIIFGLLVSFLPGFCFQILNQFSSVMFYIFLNGFEQIFLCLLGSKTGNSLQFLRSLYIEFFHLCGSLLKGLFPVCQTCFPFFHCFGLLVQILFFAQYTSFIALKLSSSFLCFFLKLILCL